MNSSRRTLHALLLSAGISGLLGTSITAAHAETAADLNREADNSLQVLYSTNPTALAISKQAKGTLIFPKIVKAGFVFGGAYGEGVLRGTRHDGYFNSVQASWGLQAGAESYGYVVFLMNQKAENYLNTSAGWEVGVGPSVVVVDSGVAKNLTTTTLQSDAYAFIFDQQGLMVSLSIEGTKISRINRP